MVLYNSVTKDRWQAGRVSADESTDTHEYIGGEIVQTPGGQGVVVEAVPPGSTQVPVRFEDGTGTQTYRPEQLTLLEGPPTSGAA